MKRFLILCVLLVLPVAAYAGWNIRQKDDGSTVWTNEDSKDVPVGDSGLTVMITDLSAAGSSYITSHKAGTLKKIYAVVDGGIAGGAVTLSFHISDYQSTPSTGTGPTPVSTGATIVFPLAGAGGDMLSTSPVLGPRPATDGSTVSVNQGDVIIVYTDGGSTGAQRATITYIIE